MKFTVGVLALVALSVLQSASGIVIQGRNSTTNASTVVVKAKQAPSTFEAYYNTHTGRGVWKWSHYLVAYQNHVSAYIGKPVAMLEIGVQSGGSINMWETVLGAQCHYYGMDINKNCVKFNDARTTIYIGDQASAPAWNHFFQYVTPTLDFVIDDGGHQAHQMLATVQQTLPHLKVGGFHATEDIHGINDDYFSKFLSPAADMIGNFHGSTGKVQSVHLYPFVMAVQMAGRPDPVFPAATVTVTTIPELLAALSQHPGGTISLANPAWGSFLTADALKNMFSSFYELHGGVVNEVPAECHNTMANDCAMVVANTNQQNLVKGVHVLPTQVLVELHPAPPQIAAHRKGTEWIAYNGP